MILEEVTLKRSGILYSRQYTSISKQLQAAKDSNSRRSPFTDLQTLNADFASVYRLFATDFRSRALALGLYGIHARVDYNDELPIIPLVHEPASISFGRSIVEVAGWANVERGSSGCSDWLCFRFVLWVWILRNLRLTMMSDPTMQFLNSVLSQRGPQALPYVEDDKWSVREHLLLLVQAFPGLKVKPSAFTHNDGRTTNLLQVNGVIPMHYQEVQYNIPIIMWLLEPYPRQAPQVYVTPLQGMEIKHRHPFVNPSGMVQAAYVQHWVYPRSNLVGLVQSLCRLFGQDPPLYARPPPIHMQTNPGPSPSPRLARHDSQDVYKRSLVTSLTERLKGSVDQMVQERNEEMEMIYHTQVLLAQRSEQLKHGHRELVEEKGALENQLQGTLANTVILEHWLRANDKGVNFPASIDDVFEPADPLSKQLLECQASDLAIEDILYAVDKGAQELVIPVEAYLKHVRGLAREQFFHRATSQRISQLQLSQSMAARFRGVGV